MKYGLLTILILWTINPCLAQGIEKIVIVSQKADEPPTKPGPAEYRIEYKINSDGDFIATDVKKDSKKRRLSEIKKIEGQRIKKIQHWENSKKVNFTILDLSIDRETLEFEAQKSNYRLNFPIPGEFVLNVDSFKFCQNYIMTKSTSTGGERISVTMRSKSTPTAQFFFYANDIGRGEFKLKEYIFGYAILNDRIPDEFPHFNFFSKEKLAEIVVYYQKTVECEGYYYQEYADKNQLTGKERRMKEGWDFVEYMRERTTTN